MTVWLVLTSPLHFVEIFATLPTYDVKSGWYGTLIEKLDPESVEALRFERLLWPNLPQACDLVLGGASRWHVVRWNTGIDAYVSLCRDLQPKVTYCWRSIAALHLSQFPLGQLIAIVPQSQRSVMPHPKYGEFKQQYLDKHGAKGKGTKGKIDAEDFEEFARALIANSRLVPVEDLPALINDLEADLSSIIKDLTAK